MPTIHLRRRGIVDTLRIMRSNSSPSRTRYGLVISVIAFVAVAGCGNNSNDDPTPGQSVSTTKAIPEAVRESANIKANSLSLTELIFGNRDTRHTDRVRQEIAISRCMHERGFTYVPFIPDVKYFADYDERVTQKDWAYEQFTVIGRESEHLEATQHDYMADNPNTKLTIEMSDDELASYDTALTGNQRDADPLGHSNDTDGCDDLTAETTISSDFLTEDQFDDFMFQSGDIDSRTSTAEQAWSACMTAAGHAFTKPSETAIYVSAKLASALAETEPAKAAALQAGYLEETAISASDLECRAETTDALAKTIRAERDAAFLTKYPDLELRLRDRARKHFEG